MNTGPEWLRTPDDVNALVPALWPANVARGPHGALTVGGLRADDLAAEFGTPVYVLDEADLRARCRAFVTAFEDGDVYYAGKAFLSKAVVKIIAEEGLSLDACSGGELATALAAGMDPARIALHGNNKSESELRRALDAGVGRIVVDSFDEIDRLSRLARGREPAAAGGAPARPAVLLRLTVGVEAHTHEFTATAHEDQKFGFSVAGGAAARAVDKILGEGLLELRGFHSHIGSQIFDTGGFELAARRVVALMAAVRDTHGRALPELDLGGGFGIAYTTQDRPASPAELARSFRAIVAAECAAAGLPEPRLSVEPGRAVIGPSMFTLYEVGTVKEVAGLRTYVSVDGGMSDNIRSALYGAAYSATVAGRRSTAGPILARVVGKHCESGDILVKDEFLPADIRPGDLLAVPGTGAYGRSMASNYNHVPRPAVIAVAGGRARVIVRRETEDDLLALDVG
ncbi:MAG TPA: diaminopimelate decarboxylase [Micromonosporaceae bacterium]|nr:diaminopimelate decarboxylase [Micromonosporaceae bacterium]